MASKRHSARQRIRMNVSRFEIGTTIFKAYVLRMIDARARRSTFACYSDRGGHDDTGGSRGAEFFRYYHRRASRAAGGRGAGATPGRLAELSWPSDPGDRAEPGGKRNRWRDAHGFPALQ